MTPFDRYPCLDKPQFRPPRFFWDWLWLALLITFLVFLLFPPKAKAEEIDFKVVMLIESGGNPNAYNPNSGARGLFQITKVCWLDYAQNNKQLNGVVHYEDLYDPEQNTKIAKWYFNVRIPQFLKNYSIPDTTEYRLIAYNWGIGNLNKWYKSGGKKKDLPKETKSYIKKYKRLSNADPLY